MPTFNEEKQLITGYGAETSAGEGLQAFMDNRRNVGMSRAYVDREHHQEQTGRILGVLAGNRLFTTEIIDQDSLSDMYSMATKVSNAIEPPFTHYEYHGFTAAMDDMRLASIDLRERESV